MNNLSDVIVDKAILVNSKGYAWFMLKHTRKVYVRKVYIRNFGKLSYREVRINNEMYFLDESVIIKSTEDRKAPYFNYYGFN